MKLKKRLELFWKEHDFSGKGALSLALILTSVARDKEFPISPDSLITGKGGQVRGLSGGAIKRILKKHEIHRVLSSEGGRTSRGSIDNMRVYVSLLNKIAKSKKPVDFDFIEQWWIEKVCDYFRKEPFQLNDRGSDSVQTIVADLLKQATKRQSETPGSTYTGTMLQHLVGAKLGISQPDENIEHHAASVADQPTGRHGDFLVGDSAIHVTTSPSDALGQKCADNLRQGKRPIIITLRDCYGAATQIARTYNIESSLEVFSVEQFVATNIQEWSGFQSSDRRKTLIELIERYNQLVNEHENDPSLLIKVE